MTPEEQLDEIGRFIRMSELSDKDTITLLVKQVLWGTVYAGYELTIDMLADMLAVGLVDLGGYHRAAHCFEGVEKDIK